MRSLPKRFNTKVTIEKGTKDINLDLSRDRRTNRFPPNLFELTLPQPKKISGLSTKKKMYEY